MTAVTAYNPINPDVQKVCLVAAVQRRIQGGSLGSDEPPLRPGVVVENARTAWLYQGSSVRDIFTEIVPQLYTT